jgi:hypothetical protein
VEASDRTRESQTLAGRSPVLAVVVVHRARTEAQPPSFRESTTAEFSRKDETIADPSSGLLTEPLEPDAVVRESANSRAKAFRTTRTGQTLCEKENRSAVEVLFEGAAACEPRTPRKLSARRYVF